MGLCIAFARGVCGNGIIGLDEKFVRLLFAVKEDDEVVVILPIGFDCVCRGNCFAPVPYELGICSCDRPGVDMAIEFVVCVIGILVIVCIALRPLNIVFCVELIDVAKPMGLVCWNAPPPVLVTTTGCMPRVG